MWYAFRNDNKNTQYGWTDNPAVRDAVLEQLNRQQQRNTFSATGVNAWYWVEISEDEADALGLKDYPLACDDDTRPEDFDITE